MTQQDNHTLDFDEYLHQGGGAKHEEESKPLALLTRQVPDKYPTS